MTPKALQDAARVLAELIAAAIPKPSGTGFLLEIEPCEMEVLRDHSAALRLMVAQAKKTPPVNG